MHTITLRVKSAIVISGFGTDRISLELDVPTPFPDMGYPACAKIETRDGYGVQWCREVLGIEPEVIDRRIPPEVRIDVIDDDGKSVL